MKPIKRVTFAAIGLGLITAASAHALARNANADPGSAQQKSNTQSAQQNAGAQQKASAGQGMQDEPIVLTVTTVAFAESTGCWARIHDGENFSGRTLTLMGKQSLRNLEFGIGTDWEGDIDSIEVGPKATLTLYDDENYMDDKRDLGPNSKVANLHQTPFDEGIESMRLTCSGAATR